MELVKIKNKNDDMENMKKLYLRAFPKEERAPFWLLKSKSKKDFVDFLAIYDESKWVGFAYVIRYEKLAYIFYLAIDDSVRGKGYGTKTLKKLKEKYDGYKIFLALETLDKNADNYEQRVKRHNFYRNAGLKDFPYKLREATMVYSIMGFGEKVEPSEYQNLISNYIGKVFSGIFRMRIEK